MERAALKRILALENVEYNPTGNPTDNPTDLALISHNIQLIHFFQKKRQPSGLQCGSICNSDTSTFFAWRKPSGDCLDGWEIRRINRMEGDGI